MASIVEIVKIVGMGAEGGLPGLICMSPTNAFMTQLNDGARLATEHYAIATNFEPFGSLINLFKDGAVDLVFQDLANDVAVPTTGVGAPGKDPGFPVLPENAYTFAAGNVWHCSYFAQDITQARITAWLCP